MTAPRSDPARIDALRADLQEARFTVDAVRQLWGEGADAALGRGHRTAARRALDALPASALATLCRAFLLGMGVTPGELDTALPRLGAAGALRLGLVDEEGSPLVDLRPYEFVDAQGAGRWWIASDLGELAVGGALREDHVLGIGGASTTLASIMMPTAVDTTLDLGTGCGIQALHAARFSRRVIATDVSERALAFARFNAALNAVDGIEVRAGDRFAPLEGERVDRIVSNPPFVITPRRAGVPTYEYRDGGLVGDALIESVVRGAADALTPGGTAQLLGNWEYRAGKDGLARAAAWAERAGLDAWIVEREAQSAEQYAETWIRDGGTRPGDPAFDDLLDAWLDDFDRRGVQRVGFGYLLLRRPTGRPRPVRTERLHGPVGGALGAHLASSLLAMDRLAALDDDALLARRLRRAPDVTEERHYWPGDSDPTVIRLRQGTGFARERDTGTALAALVGACDGELTAAAILAALADLLDADPAALRAELLPQLRELVADGMLLLPGDPGYA